MNTGNALEAVEQAVRHMELDEVFNAGYGSVLTTDGTVECEASVMCGKSLKAGCVTGLSDVKHPISLAIKVMQKTPHNFLGFQGAMKFAKQQKDIEFVEPGSLVTEYAREGLEDWKRDCQSGKTSFAKTEIGHKKGEKGDTVGAVAVDQFGNFAVATSTGGITGKLPGRIGDTPVLGGGSYCDNRYGGVSTTGHGETIMKACLAHDIVKRIEYLNEDAQVATETACKNMTDRFFGTGGAISIDHKGRVGVSFTSKRMSWAYQKKNVMHFGIEQGDDFHEEVVHIKYDEY